MVIDFGDLIEMTKSTLDELKLRPIEAAKIASTRQRVKANGSGYNEVSAP